MSLATVFNKLGQTVIPKIGAAVFPDTLTVTGETTTQGTGGGIIKSAATNVYTTVPCAYEPLKTENRLNSADKLISTQQYMVTIPTHKSGTRINLDPKTHKLVVNARGNEPAKTFRIVAVGDTMGVVFEVTCEKEN